MAQQSYGDLEKWSKVTSILKIHDKFAAKCAQFLQILTWILSVKVLKSSFVLPQDFWNPTLSRIPLSSRQVDLD